MVSPERSSPWLRAGGSWVFAKDNFLVSVLTSTHTQEKTEAASEGGSGAGEDFKGRGCCGRGQKGAGGWGGPRALTSSAIFQTFDPFRKARCFPAAAAAARPHPSGRQRARRPGAGPSHHLPRSEQPPSPPPPGPLTAARAPPGPRRTPPAPLSRLPGPRPARPSPFPSAATRALCEPLTLSPSPRSQRRLALPPGRCSRRHGGPAAAAVAAAPAGLHA